MTCVLGVECAGKVIIAGDSGVWDSAEEDVIRAHPGCEKVVKLRDGLIVGFAGVVGLAQRFLESLARQTGEMNQNVIRTAMDAAQEAHTDSDDTISALVGVGDALYAVTSDGSVVRSADGMMGIGSYQYALGYLMGRVEAPFRDHGEGGIDWTMGVLQHALACQERFSSSCRHPYVVRTT